MVVVITLIKEKGCYMNAYPQNRKKISYLATLTVCLLAYTTYLVASPQFEVFLSGPTSITDGQRDVTYTITLKNAGSTDLTDLTIEFPIPPSYKLSAERAYLDEEDFGFNFTVQNGVLVASAPGQTLYGPPYYESIDVAITFDVTGDVYAPVATNQVTATASALGETLVAISNPLKVFVDAESHIRLIEEPKVKHESALNAKDGSITLLVNGGTGIYQVIAKNLTTGNSLTVEGDEWGLLEVGPLEPGFYEIEIIDSEGNSRSYSVGSSFTTVAAWVEEDGQEEVVETPAVVEVPAVVIPDPVVIESVTRAGGTLTIAASGGTGQLSYSVNGGKNFTVSNTFKGLVAGTYTLVVKDQVGVTATRTEKIAPLVAPQKPATQATSQRSTLKILTTQKKASRKGLPTGSITIKAAGGSGGLSYSINGGSSFSSNNTFSGLKAGTYSVVVKDAKGSRVSASIQIGIQG